MVCKGNPDNPSEGTEWPLAKTRMVLGHIVQDDGGIREDWNHTVASMWRCYWSSVGSKRAKNLSAAGKALLLQRAVVSNFLWKISRWPFQKSVAILLDKTQCKMLSHILPCPVGVGETVDHYCRRRARLARNVSIESGAWSKLWCNRVGRWDQHVRRGVVYHFCHDLMLHHSSQWLLLQRAVFTTENSERCTLTAGRTGTRLNIGRPQPRWDSGVQIAKAVLETRVMSEQGGNALSIGTIVRNAVIATRQFSDNLALNN